MKNIARITGFGYLMIFISGIYANFAVLESLVDLSDASLTVSNLVSNQNQLLLGILGFIVMVLFDAVLVWTIYRLFEAADKRLSQISALFRLVNVIFFAVALGNLLLAYQQIGVINESGLALTQLHEDQLFKLIAGFDQIWIIGLIFFGVHLAFVGVLIRRSAIFPGWIGILLFIAAAGYLVDSLAHLFLPSYNNYQDIFMLLVVVPGVIGELSFTLFLLFKRNFESHN